MVWYEWSGDVSAPKKGLCMRGQSSERLGKGADNVFAETSGIGLVFEDCERVGERLDMAGYDGVRLAVLCDCQPAISIVLGPAARGGVEVEPAYWGIREHVQKCIARLCSDERPIRWSITVEWVPGHTGMEGNEKADELAKAAMTRSKTAKTSQPGGRVRVGRPYALVAKSIRRRGKILDREQFLSRTSGGRMRDALGGLPIVGMYKVYREASKGLNLNEDEFLPWTRKAEICIGRLRMAQEVTTLTRRHAGNAHMSSDCPICGNAEGTTAHLLYACQKLDEDRQMLARELGVIGEGKLRVEQEVLFGLKGVPAKDRPLVLLLLARFLRSTRLDGLLTSIAIPEGIG